MYVRMSSTPCSKCSAPVPAGARYCPRCGHEVGAPVPTGADPSEERWPNKSRMPVAGILFLIAAVLGPIIVVGGIYTGNAFLIVSGIFVCAVLVLLLMLGMVF
jgi:hypothetical protein